MQELTQFLSQNALLLGLFAGLLIFFLFNEFKLRQANQIVLDEQDFVQFMNRKGAIVVDTRPLAAFKAGTIAGSIHADNLTESHPVFKRQKPVVLLDEAGNAARRLAKQLTAKGVSCFAIKGGIQSLKVANIPLVKG